LLLLITLSLVPLPATPQAGAAGGVVLDPQSFFGASDITISVDTVFDTDTGAVSPDIWVGGSANVDAGGTGLTAFTANNITITAGAHVSYVGRRSLALLAKGDMVVSGTINADGQGLPGGSISQPAQGPGAGMAGSMSIYGGGGGGGGSFGTPGGRGGSMPSPYTGGLPGFTNGPSDMSMLAIFPVGSGGGHGGACNPNDTSRGGAGGGGIALIALGTINLSNGTIGAKGGFAQTSVAGDGANAGGSGGAVMIVAPAFTDSNAFYNPVGGDGGSASAGACAQNLGGGGAGGGGRGSGGATRGDNGGLAVLFRRPFVTLSAPNAGVAANTLPFGATLAVGSASNYAWAFGDGGTANATGSSTTHAYSMPGTYTVTLTATMSGTGALSSNSAVLSISDAPISGLSAASSSPTVLGKTTYFSATLSSGTNVTYAWSYGDSMSGGGSNPQHMYAAPGIYTASVTATNSISTTNATTNVSVLWANYLPLIRR